MKLIWIITIYQIVLKKRQDVILKVFLIKKIDSTELLPSSYIHQYRYWKGIIRKKSDFDVEEIFNNNNIKNYSQLISLDGITERIIKEPLSSSYDKLIKYYASRNILLERGILEKKEQNKQQ